MPQDDQVYVNVVKQDIVKYDVTVKSLIQEIREHSGTQAELDELGSFVHSRISQLREQIEELKRLAQVGISGLIELLITINPMVTVHHTRVTFELKVDKTTKTGRLSVRFLRAVTETVAWVRCGAVAAGGGCGRWLRAAVAGWRQRIGTWSGGGLGKLFTLTVISTVNILIITVEGSQTIGTTQEELKTMGSVIGQARKILNKYGRRENTDKLLIFLGLVFFLASCLVVLRNRFIF
ncbi:vesicle transport protein SEC20-like [Penaeus japonicus]|uniref:vesicle transport protein SEC20-like n=1 Tax=Penaeus japonicus TaxID=27405 RepID=UPI001C717801|nr:vesicle transport protein SEC20-like [Penaeus japonicus]